MPLMTFDRVSLAYGLKPLLDGVELTIDDGEKIALVGRNGEGKSSLLKILAGLIEPDAGQIVRQEGLVVAYLDQHLPERNATRVFDVVASGLPRCGALLTEFHQLANGSLEGEALERFTHLQTEMEAEDAWSLQQKVETVISRLELDGEALMQDLSGGWRRRVLLGKALVADPQLLLLDEPTNHLDIPAIEWLERFIAEYRGTVVVVTHDRRFLASIVNRVLELDRGRLYSFQGSYPLYLEQRDKRLEDEARADALFDKKLAAEEVWIRQGIKARRTRNEGRVRALKALRREHAERRGKQGLVNLDLEQARQSGRQVLEARNVSFAYDDWPIIQDFSFVLMRGDRVGILGGNGAGKSTLIKLLLGQLQPSSGEIIRGTQLEVAYFDQLRDQIDLDKSVQDNLSEGRDFIEINGKRKHIIGYLGDFLFPPERCRTPARALSGGERNRLMLARLFSKPANVLVLDEPTNDLDMETLELLEDLLTEFKGTLLVVSHDREFLEQVVTSTLAFEGRGRIAEYVGGYDDWLRQGKGFVDCRRVAARAESPSPATSAPSTPAASAASTPATTPPAKGPKLSYKLQRELEQLPGQIERQEALIAELHAKVGTPDFYSGPAAEVKATLERMAVEETRLETLMERWLELESGQ